MGGVGNCPLAPNVYATEGRDGVDELKSYKMTFFSFCLHELKRTPSKIADLQFPGKLFKIS